MMAPTKQKTTNKTGQARTDIPKSDAASIKARNANATKRQKATTNKKRKPKTKASAGPPPGFQPPRDETLPSNIRQPSTHRERLLPLVDVGSRKFEELCLDIIEFAFPQLARSALKRTSGVEQYGVDIEGFDLNSDPCVVISAKCYRKISAWDFRPWIDDFLKHLDGHWTGKNVKDFVLAITQECNDDDMNDASRQLVKSLQDRGITYHLWDSKRITDYLAKNPALIDRYFNKYWVDALSAELSSTSPLAVASSQTPPPAIYEYLQQIAAHSSAAVALSDVMSARLDEALRASRRGQSSEFRKWYAETKSDLRTWEALPAQTRARALRGMALLSVRDGDTNSAEELAREADKISPAVDCTVRALIARVTKSTEAALAEIGEPRTIRDSEIKAALLIEASRLPEASKILHSVAGADVSPEILRLRAIAAFISGDRPAALRNATSASNRAPDEFAPQLTLATVRFFSALAEGVRLQFSNAPEPISPGLVLATPDARLLLVQAHSDFSRLAHIVEDPLKSGVEVWALAALLLNPERQEEGHWAATSLLARRPLDPLAVAWAASLNLIKRPGKIKKALGDAIRTGKGSPGHIAVLAQISAGARHPNRGLAVLGRYSALFPEAAEFFAEFRPRFGDLSSSPRNSYAIAIRRSLDENDNSPLLEFLRSTDARTEDTLLGAEFLAWRSAWSDITGFLEQLIKMGTARATELAAEAALRAGLPSRCVAITTQALNDVHDGPSSRRLTYLRIRANQALGAHSEVIGDLIAIRKQGGDAFADRDLIDAFLRIGALPQLKQEADRAIAAGKLDAAQALQIAYVLRSHAPGTARAALALVAEAGVPPQLVGNVLSLSAQLGLSEVQNSMMRMLQSPDVAEASQVRLLSIDDLQTFISDQSLVNQKSSEEYRSNFNEWLFGRMPAAVALHADQKTYAKLFLAEPGWRTNRIGDALPMLLLSAARKEPHLTPSEELPLLRADLSALLLAANLSVIDEVEKAFRIQIPNRSAESLLLMEEQFAALDPEISKLCRNVLIPGRSAVCVVEALPLDAVAVELNEPQIVRVLLEQAFVGGHISRDDANAAVENFPACDNLAETRFDKISVSGNALIQLAALRILEQIACGTQVFVCRSEADQLLRHIELLEQEDIFRAKIASLRATVADRLRSGAWSTLPKTAEADRIQPNMPSHLGCVLEIIAAQEHSEGLFWIEDRVISHSGLSGSLCILDVLQILESKCIISRRSGLDYVQRLRHFGYSYIPIDNSTIVEQVKCAPIDEFGLIETLELATWRRSLPAEIARLPYLVSAQVLSQDGTIEGETRHALRVWGFAREILMQIWSDHGASIAEKRARSEWVWTSLRVDRFEGMPVDADPTSRTRFVAINTAYVFDIPLLSSLEKQGMDVETQQAFAEWFLNIAIEPLSKTDPMALDFFAETQATLVSQLLSKSGNPEGSDTYNTLREEDREWLSKRSRYLAYRFLGLLPESIREKVLDKNAIRETLEIRVSSTLTVLGTEIPLQELAPAFAAVQESARAGRSASFEIKGSDKTCKLEAVVSDTDVPPKLVVGDKEFGFDPLYAALLEPDVARRSSGLHIEAIKLDPLGGISPSELISIADIGDVDHRFRAYQELSELDLYGKMKGLEDRLIREATLAIDDLVLPSPLSFSRFLAWEEIDGVTQPKGLIGSLRHRFSIEESARRIAGLPLCVPGEFLREFGIHLLQFVGPRLPRALRSPLLALLELRALGAVGTDQQTLAIAVTRFLDVWRDNGKLFVAILRYFSASAIRLRNEQWSDLDPVKRVSFLWSMADQLTQILGPDGSVSQQLSEWISAIRKFDLADYDFQSKLPKWVPEITTALDEDRLQATILASLIEDGTTAQLPDSCIDLLGNLAGAYGENGWYPAGACLETPALTPKIIWANSDPMCSFDKIGWLDPRDIFRIRDPDILLPCLLAAIPTLSPPQIFGPVLSFVDLESARQELMPILDIALEKLQSEEAFEIESGATARTLAARAEIFARQGRVDEMHMLLATVASRAAQQWPNEPLRFKDTGTNASRTAANLFDVARMHAFALPRQRSEQMAILSEGLVAIALAWPKAGRRLIGLLDTIVRYADVSTASAAWPALLRLRAMA